MVPYPGGHAEQMQKGNERDAHREECQGRGSAQPALHLRGDVCCCCNVVEWWLRARAGRHALA